MRSEVQIFPDPPFCGGAIAQLGERLPCTQEVVGSIPSGSTNFARTLLQTIKLLTRDLVSLVSTELKKNFLRSVTLFNNLDISF